ncbi:MAG: DNA polymerase III subunit alpha [Syntrophobacteraceae bacterium]|nr:DNA polymerase III subunit alpha [Syntrophobacteraceae bacterium]
MSPDFVHLHVHSHYSMMHGVNSPESLCREAKKAGFSRLAITDRNGFYGLVNFLEAAAATGIDPIVGARVKTSQTSAVILAKTPQGYEIVSDIITRRHTEDDFSLPRGFPEKSPDLIVISPDPELLKSLRGRIECYLEIVPGPRDRELLRIANEIRIAPVATNAVHFAGKNDYPLHRLLRAIDCNKTLGSLSREDTALPGQWLKSAREMSVCFPDCPEALANAVGIAAACYTHPNRFPTVFPAYRDKNEDHLALLVDKCRKAIVWRYGKTDPGIEKRLLEELELISAKGFVDYFLIVSDIVSRRAIHCGRGSGAASLVSYLLGITHVDPITHDLQFERFLNPERMDLPDIDVDFPWDERDGLFEELTAHYGDHRLAFICNHTGFRARGSVREVAKVYGIPASEIKEATSRLSYWSAQGGGKTHPKFQNFPLSPPWPEIFDLALRLESIPRNISTHCGGVVIVPDRVSRYVPVQISAKGVRIIQWEKDQAEKAGLVKIDLLGNRTLAVIRDAIEAVWRNTGTRIDYASFNPVKDPRAQKIISRGDTMGVFYLESPAMRLLQAKAGRGDFDHAVIHSSIIRPAANRFIRQYLLRLHGEPFKALHPSLEKILAQSYGILVYQEDVVRSAMALAGFTWGEADRLRKAISKKGSAQLADCKARFERGCEKNSVPADVVEKVWDMFTSFAGYSFCKPHSASYALVSYKSAYLKARHPAEFMAAVISNGGGYYTTFAYISESRRMGLEVLLPDINESALPFTGVGKTLRIGFKQLQGLRKTAMEALICERNRSGPFFSIEELLERLRSKLSLADAVILAKSGALDTICGPLNRPRILWLIEAWFNRVNVSPVFQTSLFRPPRVKIPPLPDFSPPQNLAHEYETLGFPLSVHPLELAVIRTPTVAASTMAHYIGKKITMLGWPVTRKEVYTREGEEMEFFTFEDLSGIFETVFFPKPFARFCQDLDMSHVYQLHGLVESEFGVATLTVHHARRIPTNPAGPAPGLRR